MTEKTLSGKDMSNMVIVNKLGTAGFLNVIYTSKTEEE